MKLSHCEECNDEYVAACVSVDPLSQLFDSTRWSTFQRALHFVARIIRFISNCKSHSVKTSGSLSYYELTKGKEKLFYCIQREAYSSEITAPTQGKPLHRGSSLTKLDPFLDNDSLLRIIGRLEHADLSFEAKHPIIIPSSHIAKLLVQFQHVFLKHAGVLAIVSTLKNGYWKVQLCRIAKAVCRECVTCHRHNSKACSQPVAPVPEL